MEHIGAISEGDHWSSLSGMYTTEEADFMAQLLGNSSLFSDQVDSSSHLGVPSSFWSGQDSTAMRLVSEGSFCSLDVSTNYTNLNHFSEGSSSFSGGGGSSSILFPSSSSQESYYFSDSSHPNNLMKNSSSMSSMDFCMGDHGTNTTSYLVEGEGDCSNQEISNDNAEDQPEAAAALPKTELEIPAMLEVAEEDKNNKNNNNPSENSKKRSRKSDNAQKNTKRNVRSKKNQKVVSTTNDEEENDAAANLNVPPSSTSCCSEDDSNGGVSSSPKENPSALNLNGKTRASRGAATDPQSLYARKRRERINERLRILQNLVPNGTKVDISTMLEEAVEYVKFLQLQIKLLSSDDLWMYAPIAYNGMHIGLDLNIHQRE